MASQDIPYEDEVIQQGEDDPSKVDGHNAADDNATSQPSTASDHSDHSSRDSSSDEVAKMERTVAAMQAKLKSIGKQKKTTKAGPC